MFPDFCYNEWSCYKHFHASLFADVCFHFSWVHTKEWKCWVMKEMPAEIYKKLPNVLEALYFHLLSPAMHEHCNTSTSSPILGVASLFTLCQASRCLVVCSLNSENTRTHTYTHVSFLLIVVTHTFSHITNVLYKHKDYT